tara:strand:+ start:29674 stop:30375 length:702 start_codon:yes stop_codon:yes gene_type:complete
MRNLGINVAVAGLFLVAAGHSRADSPVEIGFLIRQALEHQNGGLLEWSFLSRSDSPVDWQTNGIDFQDYTRRGEVIASVDGFVPEVLKKEISVQPWEVVLKGYKQGIYAVSFFNDGCFGTTSLSSQCASRLEQIPSSLTLSGVSNIKICEFGPGAAFSRVYRASIKGKPPAYIHLQTSGGSGGAFINATILLKLESSFADAELQHDSAVCGILFSDHEGFNGSLAWDYRQRLR